MSKREDWKVHLHILGPASRNGKPCMTIDAVVSTAAKDAVLRILDADFNTEIHGACRFPGSCEHRADNAEPPDEESTIARMDKEIERLREGLSLIECEPINAEHMARNILDGKPAYHDTMIKVGADETAHNAEVTGRASAACEGPR